MPGPYNEYIEILSRKFSARLDDILPDFNFDYGPEFEIAVCEILRMFLPQNYGVCRGHVVSFNGEKKGDDIIIYDHLRFPTIRLHDKDQYARKENIPIESVYAYFEAKHKLTQDTLTTALNQIRQVKELINRRPPVSIESFDPYLDPLDRESHYSQDFPNYRNPVFCGIISRRTDFTNEELEHMEGNFERSLTNPDIILFSSQDYFQIGYDEKDGFKPTLFLNTTKDFSYAHVKNDRNLCFGIFLSNLIASLDWIRLGRIKWLKILNQYVSNE